MTVDFCDIELAELSISDIKGDKPLTKYNELELARQAVLKAKRKYEALRAQWIDSHEITG
jgi:hypothetical protein